MNCIGVQWSAVVSRHDMNFTAVGFVSNIYPGNIRSQR